MTYLVARQVSNQRQLWNCWGKEVLHVSQLQGLWQDPPRGRGHRQQRPLQSVPQEEGEGGQVMDIVILRRWKAKPRTLIALFPEDLVTPAGYVNSYEHIGQHGGSYYEGVIRATKPEPRDSEEAIALLTELRGIGYQPVVRQ